MNNVFLQAEGRPFCYPDDKLDQILARFEKCRTFEFEAEFGIDQDQLIVGTAAAVLKGNVIFSLFIVDDSLKFEIPLSYSRLSPK